MPGSRGAGRTAAIGSHIGVIGVAALGVLSTQRRTPLAEVTRTRTLWAVAGGGGHPEFPRMQAHTHAGTHTHAPIDTLTLVLIRTHTRNHSYSHSG